LVTGDHAIHSWQGKDEKVKKICEAKRDRMEYHMLRKEAEDFEAARLLKQTQEHFKKLERQGVVASPQRLEEAEKNLQTAEKNLQTVEKNLQTAEKNLHTTEKNLHTTNTLSIIGFTVVIILFAIIFTRLPTT